MARGNSGFISENPVLRRMKKTAVFDGADSCSYKGVLAKLVFFLVVIGIGVGLCFMVKAGTNPAADGNAFVGKVFEDGETVVIGGQEIIWVAAAGIVTLIAPLLAVFIRPTIPVTGSLFCAATGFILAWLAATFGDVYRAPILLALVITLIIVFTMGFLYGMGIIKVGQKFKGFIMTAMITVCLGSLLLFIGSLIPGVNTFVAALSANPVLSIGGSLLMVVLGTLFLLVDFDTVRECVEGGLPRKYEWYASFGLIFSVIWLYFKVLDLVLKIMGNSRD